MTMKPSERKSRPGPGPASDLFEPAGLEASTGYLLARVGTESRRRWAHTLVDLELTPHHYSALMALDQLGAMSQAQLSRHVGIDPRNAVPVIRQLEARGLVEREPDPLNRRRHSVSLSASGSTAVLALGHRADEAERVLLDPLTARERIVLHHVLTKLFTPINTSDTSGQATERKT